MPEHLPMPALAFTFGCSTDKLLRLRGFIELKKFHLNMEIILFTEILLREILFWISATFYLHGNYFYKYFTNMYTIMYTIMDAHFSLNYVCVFSLLVFDQKLPLLLWYASWSWLENWQTYHNVKEINENFSSDRLFMGRWSNIRTQGYHFSSSKGLTVHLSKIHDKRTGSLRSFKFNLDHRF